MPIISRAAIQKRVKELGQEVSKDYQGKNPLLVGILKGSFVFLADLIRHLTIPHEVDFISVASYGPATEASGVVQLLKDLNCHIKGREVVIVEDIVDTGLTVNYIRNNLLARSPRSVAILAFLDKKERRQVRVRLKYIGFTVPKDFVVGYGLDFNEQYRNLPYIGKIKPEAQKRAKGLP